jgi:tRNA (mo5U34)-methyltransferase
VTSVRQQQIEALGPWFHNVHLPDGSQTAPDHPYGDFPTFKWQEVSRILPADLRGWSVLDIGCNAGFYSVELARRGAQVLGIELEPHYLRQARWVAAHCGLSERIELCEADVYELLHWQRQFDLVWFTGVFYHLRYPLLALDLVRSVCRRALMFQSMTVPGERVTQVPENLTLEERAVLRDAGWPSMAFIEHRLANDGTNWWVPNHAGVEALLRAAGFRVQCRPGHEFYWCEPVDEQRPADLLRIARRAAAAQ